jgi:hypothetical protein
MIIVAIKTQSCTGDRACLGYRSELRGYPVMMSDAVCWPIFSASGSIDHWHEELYWLLKHVPVQV